MIQEQKLKQLIKEARECLAELAFYTTRVAQISLLDMIQKAEDAEFLPFTTKREFGDWHWTRDDACQFAMRRYTMVSVWINEGSVYSTYGLADALEWYKSQDLRKQLKASELDPSRNGELSMEETWDYYENLCQDFLSDLSYGNEIGQYSRQAKDTFKEALETFRKFRAEYCQSFCEKSDEKLQQAFEKSDSEQSNLEQSYLEHSDQTETSKNRVAEALAGCLNALWELRTSRVLRSETEKEAGGNILCSAKQMEEIR